MLQAPPPVTWVSTQHCDKLGRDSTCKMPTLLPQTEPWRGPWCHQRPDRQQQPPDHMSVSRSVLRWSSRRWGQDRRKTRQTLCAQEIGRWNVTCRVQQQQHPSMKPLSCSTAKPLPQTCHNNDDSIRANPLQTVPRAACFFFFKQCHGQPAFSSSNSATGSLLFLLQTVPRAACFFFFKQCHGQPAFSSTGPVIWNWPPFSAQRVQTLLSFNLSERPTFFLSKNLKRGCLLAF